MKSLVSGNTFGLILAMSLSCSERKLKDLMSYKFAFDGIVDIVRSVAETLYACFYCLMVR